jgi:UDP-N-acetylmuramoyl-tripeptide--D-alanyl-D-alanine ligase
MAEPPPAGRGAPVGVRPLEALTAERVAALMGGQLRAGDPAAPIGAVSIDSRTLGPGDLFVALRGARFDGHDFVADALARGAIGAVVSRPVARGTRQGAVIIEVSDTLQALQALGAAIRRAVSTRVVAITGSTGKTTTKELAATFLAARYRVVRSPGNLNNHIGLPLSLIALQTCPDVAVVELGMNHPGEIRRLVEIARPEVRVWTNVAEVHRAFFPSLEAIADAKAEILEGASRDTVVVANADDPRVMARVARCGARLVTFGVEASADVRATAVTDRGVEGMAATLVTPVGRARMTTPLLGRGHLANLLAATAVALEFDIPLDAVVERVQTFEPPPGRGRVMRLRDDIVVIDDSYNASPAALERMLEVLAFEAARRRVVAALGEMLELGERAAALHEACGRLAARSGVGVLLTVGGEAAAALARAAVEAGLSAGAVEHVATSAEAAARLARLVRPGDVVLVKGSRAVRMEAVVERLRVERG